MKESCFDQNGGNPETLLSYLASRFQSVSIDFFQDGCQWALMVTIYSDKLFGKGEGWSISVTNKIVDPTKLIVDLIEGKVSTK